MHQHLGEVTAVRLVVWLRQDDLRRAYDDPLFIQCHDQCPLASLDTTGNAAPEGQRLVPRQRLHEAHRRPTGHAIEQHLGQFTQLSLVHAPQSAHRALGHRRHLRAGRGWYAAMATM